MSSIDLHLYLAIYLSIYLSIYELVSASLHRYAPLISSSLLIFSVSPTILQIEKVKRFLSNESLGNYKDFENRLRLLELCGYVDQKMETVTMKVRLFILKNKRNNFIIIESHLKSLPLCLPMSITQGRVACEMNTSDELITTEMLFANVLDGLNPPEIAGILSALVFQVRSWIFIQQCCGVS